MKNNFKSIVKAFLLIAVSILFVVFSVWLAEKVNPSKDQFKDVANQVIKQIENPTVSCPRDFDSFKSLKDKSSIELLGDRTFVNAYNGFIEDRTVVVNRYGSNSKVACGYLYIRVQKSGKPLDYWEDFYLSPGVFGGHLVSEGAVVNHNTGDYTEVLFPLGEIVYRETKNRSNPIMVADWVALLNVSNKTIFTTYVNSLDRNSSIDELVIAYKCVNPDTGKQTSDCLLEIEK